MINSWIESNGLTQEEFELYSTYLKHIDCERSTMYFSESSCHEAKPRNQPNHHSIKQLGLQGKLGSTLLENTTLNSLEENIKCASTAESHLLNCYLTLGFVKPGRNKIIPMNFCIFAKKDDFFKVYDQIPNVTNDKYPRMRQLTKQEQEIVESRIIQFDGPQTLDAVKKTGIYNLPNMHMFDDILRAGF